MHSSLRRLTLLCAASFLLPIASVVARVPADQPFERTDENSRLAHQKLLEKAKQGRIDVYFLGDSITRRWGATDYPKFLENWKANFYGWNAADFGWGGDTTQNIIWRLQNGELDGVKPKVIVLLAGTNNVGRSPAADTAEDVPKGIKAILDLCQAKAPEATILLTAIFPRNDGEGEASNQAIVKINEAIEKFADGKRVRFININDRLADPSGKLFEGMTVDKLHLTEKGYQIWADALKPRLTDILGAPAKTDLAPSPTGDPKSGK